MLSKPKCPVIAIEEHYWDAELAKTFQGPEAPKGGDIDKRLGGPAIKPVASFPFALPRTTLPR